MSGRVIKVYVSAREHVEIDQPLLVIEAMKMENIICADDKKTVSSVCVTEGDTVSQGQILIEFVQTK